jgi:hypothetical protein
VSEHRGTCVFSDDRQYTFEYEPSTKTIYWDGKQSGNIWTKKSQWLQPTQFDDGTIVGSYGNMMVEISVDENNVIFGRWLNMNGRPSFNGVFSDGNGNDQKGLIAFPDDRTFQFEYDDEMKILFWDGRNSGNKWTKDISQNSNEYQFK